MNRPGGRVVRRVTKDTIDQFKPLLRTQEQPAAEEPQDEPGQREGTPQSPASVTRDPNLAAAENLFGGSSVSVPAEYHAHPKGAAAAPAARPAPAAAPVPAARPAPAAAPVPAARPAPAAAPASLLWQKELTATDAQRQRGHTTGDLRLVQARFQDAGGTIDQTTYFRNTVFAGGNWVREGLSEVATFAFDVTILGTSFGRRGLEVSHKPSGEAGQSNYTTNVRWGPLLPVLRQQIDVTRRTFRLYRAAPGSGVQFVISIV